MRRACLLPFLLALTAALPALADGPRFGRGVNLDIWVDWRSVEDMLADPGFLEPYPDWRRVVPPDRIATLAADGFDFVRLPFDPAPLLALGPGRRSALISDIRETAEIALAGGLSVIVDLHSIPRPEEPWGTEAVVGPLWQDYLAVVEQVGRALHGLPPDRVAFEPLNEPTNDCDAVWGDAADTWPAMAADMLAAARAGTPDLPVILSGACWGGVDGLERLDPAAFGDANLFWSFHSYDPFDFSHQGAVWTDGLNRFVTGLPYPPTLLTPSDAERLAEAAAARMADAGLLPDQAGIASLIAGYRDAPADTATREITRAADWADRHGVPRDRLILGEFGALRAGSEGRYPPEWQAAFLSDKRQAAEEAGIAWAVWNWAGDMGIEHWGDRQRRIDPIPGCALGLAACGD